MPTDPPSPEQLKAWAQVMLKAMENFVQGVIQLKGKRWTIEEVIHCECGTASTSRPAPTGVLNAFEDWKVLFRCSRKNGASLRVSLTRSGFQLIEIQPQQLTHPLWTAAHLTFNGHPLTAKIYQDTQGLTSSMQEQLLLQIATEFLQANVWTPDFAQQWTALGPRLFLTVNPPSATHNCLYLVAKNRPEPDTSGSTCTVSEYIPFSDSEVSNSLLTALRKLAWTWTCALAHELLGPYHLWVKQKNNAYWAFEPLTLQALANGLQLHLVAKTPALTEILALAPDQTIVASSLKPLPGNPHRVVFPFHIKSQWEQVTQKLRYQIDEVSFTLEQHKSTVPQPLRLPQPDDISWYPIHPLKGNRPLSTIVAEQRLLMHHVSALTC